MISVEWKVSKTKKHQKFQSGFLRIFWPELNRKLSKTLKKRILDLPWPSLAAKTASASSAKKFQSQFFVLLSSGMAAESKITPKNILYGMILLLWGLILRFLDFYFTSIIIFYSYFYSFFVFLTFFLFHYIFFIFISYFFHLFILFEFLPNPNANQQVPMGTTDASTCTLLTFNL